MKTAIQETELYKKFIKALNINDMRADDNPFVVECCKIAEEHAKSSPASLKQGTKIYLCIDKDNRGIFGCFAKKEDAEKFINGSENIALQEIEVTGYSSSGHSQEERKKLKEELRQIFAHATRGFHHLKNNFERRDEAVEMILEIIEDKCLPTSEKEQLGLTDEQRLAVMEEIKFSFGIHSDFSTQCNGYQALCRRIDVLRSHLKDKGKA